MGESVNDILKNDTQFPKTGSGLSKRKMERRRRRFSALITPATPVDAGCPGIACVTARYVAQVSGWL
jgi:hypothetical protein